MSGKMSGHKKKIHPIVEGNFYVRNGQQCMRYGILRAKNYVKLKLFEWDMAYTEKWKYFTKCTITHNEYKYSDSIELSSIQNE